MSKIPPVTREEHFLARIAGDPTALVLEPKTRLEKFLQKIIDNGPGGSGDVTPAAVVAATGQMSDAQKAQTRTNLGAVSTSTMGSVYMRLEELEAAATSTETVSGATPTITPEANTIYQCGELSSLTITNPPATGAWSVVFTSGATATTTTIPASILGLEDFATEANTLYEINVLDNRAVWRDWPLPEVTNNAE